MLHELSPSVLYTSLIALSIGFIDMFQASILPYMGCVNQAEQGCGNQAEQRLMLITKSTKSLDKVKAEYIQDAYFTVMIGSSHRMC